MDPFVEKLKEYGLEARKSDRKRTLLSTVEKQLTEKSWAIQNEMKMVEMLDNDIHILINDRELFLTKIGMLEEAKKLSPFIIENTQVNTNIVEYDLELEIYDVDDYGAREFLQHLEENLAHYEDRYPEWRMQRVFQKTKADNMLCEQLYEEQSNFRQMIDERKLLSNLYNELIDATGEVLGAIKS